MGGVGVWGVKGMVGEGQGGALRKVGACFEGQGEGILLVVIKNKNKKHLSSACHGSH